MSRNQELVRTETNQRIALILLFLERDSKEHIRNEGVSTFPLSEFHSLVEGMRAKGIFMATAVSGYKRFQRNTSIAPMGSKPRPGICLFHAMSETK